MPKPWLNYHHLYYFWKVARIGSLTAAARELRLAHPTISAQLKTFERNLGTQLFEKVGRNLQLTETGRLVYRYANDIFSMGEELAGALEGRPADGARLFRVGVTDILPKPVAYRYLEPALNLPDVRMVCFEGKPESLMARLADHDLDLVLSDFPMGPQHRLNAFNHLLGESTVAIFGAAKWERKFKKGFPQSLDGAPFLLQTDNTSIRRLLNHWFAGQKVRPRVVAEFEDNELLKEYGQRGGGVFAASSIIEAQTLQHYKVRVIGRIATAHIRFYAISTERRVTNPAVAAIIESAEKDIFG